MYQKLKIMGLPLAVLCLGLAACAQPSEATAQTSATDTYKETIRFQEMNGKQTLMVANVSGDITVETYSGQEVKVEATRTLGAANAKQLADLKKELTVELEWRGNDTAVFYLNSPWAEFSKGKRSWVGYNIEWNMEDAEYRVDFTIKVPKALNLYVSTINEGEVYVNGTQGELLASNVNGGITLENVALPKKVTSVNGDLEVTLSQKLSRDCRFHTVNGDMTLKAPGPMDAKVTHKAMHGDLYTSFEVTKYLESTQETEEHEGRKRYTMRLNPGVQLGKGTHNLSFETVNGNVYIKRI